MYRLEMSIRKLSQPRNYNEDILLFSAETGVMAIDSAIKKQIIGMITERDISFNEIVSRTGKAKSTISVHIKDLEQAGLIISWPDPNDYRQKILSINSQSIGRLTNEDRLSAEKQNASPREGLPFTEGDISSFFRFMFTIIRTEAMERGINTDPILKQAGYRVGIAIKPLITGETLSDKIKNLNKFWKSYGLGSITLENDKPITLKVEGCFECQDLPITGHEACSFDSGVFTAIFLDEIPEVPVIHEIECYSSGYNHCTFIISDKSEQKYH